MRKQLFDIAVCDDVQTDREETAQLTEEICKAEGILPRIARFERAEALLEAIQGGEHFALLLVDVLLPGLDGMELARVLRGQNEQASIVFVSCNRELALLRLHEKMNLIAERQHTDQDKATWIDHYQLERGKAVRIFKGLPPKEATD